MPIYTNGKEQAIFKGDKNKSVCLIHGDNPLIPNGYYFETTQTRDSTKPTDNNDESGKKAANSDDGISYYKPWVGSKTSYQYSRNDKFLIENWTQKGKIRHFKQSMPIYFCDANDDHISIKGNYGWGYKNNHRDYTIIPITSLGDGIFTSSDVDILYMNFGQQENPETMNFYNHNRQYSFVGICNEYFGGVGHQMGYYGFKNGSFYVTYEELFNMVIDRTNADMVTLRKTICNDGADFPSVDYNLNKAGYNTYTHNYTITTNDFKDIPPYLWRYSYIIDNTEMLFGFTTWQRDKQGGPNYNGECWHIFHKSYMTINGDNYFDKHIKNKDNFFFYIDYLKSEKTLQQSTETFLVEKEGQNDMIEDILFGGGRVTKLDSLYDSSLLYLPYNYFGNFGEYKLTYKKTTYPEVEFSLPYFKTSEKKILNIIGKGNFKMPYVGSKVMFGSKGYGKIESWMYSECVLSFKRTTDLAWKFTLYPYISTKYPFMSFTQTQAGQEQVLFSDEIIKIVLAFSSSDFKKYGTMELQQGHEKSTANWNLAESIDNNKTDNCQDLYVTIDETRYTMSSRIANMKVGYTKSYNIPIMFSFYRKFIQLSTNDEYEISISYAHLFFWLHSKGFIGDYTATDDWSDYKTELWMFVCTLDDSNVDDYVSFRASMPQAYDLTVKYIKAHNLKISINGIYYGYMKTLANEENMYTFVKTQAGTLNTKWFVDKDISEYDCVFAPFAKVTKFDSSVYSDWNLIDMLPDLESDYGVLGGEKTAKITFNDIQVARDNS